MREGQLFIYIVKNSSGRIKIGRTTDPTQRLKSLSGSNGGGFKIEKYFISEPTCLYTLETIMHDKFDKYRIPNTEWFYNKDDPSGEKLFEAACEELKLLFSSASYKRCNKIRKEFWESTHKADKVDETNDN